MSTPHILAKISNKADATNKKKPCPWSRCPDSILQAIAARLPGRADVGRLVRANRQCHRAANKYLYLLDQRNDTCRSSALLWACCLSKTETARKALAAGADPNKEWPSGCVAWNVLEKHAPRFNPSSRETFSTRNALYIVASLGDVDMAKVLIESGKADFSRPVLYSAEPPGEGSGQPIRYEDPPIFSAISMDCGELVHYFLQTYGYDITDLSGNTILTRAIREQRPAAIRAILRTEHYADPLGAGHVNGLYQAVYTGDAGLVRLILSKSRSNPNLIRRRDNDHSRYHRAGIHGQTPLVAAVRHGHEAVVRALCADPRVDVNLAGPNHRPPVFYALTQARWDVFRVLVERGAAYDAELAFEQACLHGQREWMVRLVRETTFDETRLDYWCAMARRILVGECEHWSEVEPELDRKRSAFRKSDRQEERRKKKENCSNGNELTRLT